MPNWIETSLHSAVLALIRSGETEIAASLGRLLEEPEVKSLRLYKSAAAAALADRLCDCDGLDELSDLVPRICLVFSVAHCTVHRVREPNIGTYGTKVLSNYPATWLTEYIARRYFNVDPVVARALQEPGLFFWDEISRNDPVTADFARSAAGHGVGPAGVTYVADNRAGDTFAVSLAVPLGQSAFRQHFEAKLSDFTDIAALLIDVFSDLTCSAGPTGFALTEDQLKVLKALASGRTRADLEEFPVTYGSLATLERSILQSLNAKTLSQAVAIAAKQCLLETLPFFEEDIYRADCRSSAA